MNARKKLGVTIHHMSARDLKLSQADIKATLVNRKSPSGQPVMASSHVHGKISHGKNYCLSLPHRTLKKTSPVSALKDAKHRAVVAQETKVEATWFEAHQKPAVSGRDASVFGTAGSLELKHETEALSIPTIDAHHAPTEFLASYGAQLVSADATINFTGAFDDLYPVQYEFAKSYIEDYAMRADGGGGIFVEKHDFPHFFMPMSPECGGGLILGKQEETTSSNSCASYRFTAFKIPYGTALLLNANCIHGDSFFTGPYTISLTEKTKASTVLFRTPSGKIQQIKQVDVHPPIPNAKHTQNKHTLFCQRPAASNDAAFHSANVCQSTSPTLSMSDKIINKMVSFAQDVVNGCPSYFPSLTLKN
jgi:hypothetical protein